MRLNAVTLGLLRSQRAATVALAFALASAIGAAVLGALMLGLVDGAQRLGLQTFGDDWDRLMAYVQRYGLATMLLAVVFPSSPRAMVCWPVCRCLSRRVPSDLEESTCSKATGVHCLPIASED